jgi:hypothetical protein
LIRWITKINRERSHGFFDVSALLISNSTLAAGDYCYRIERWKLKGFSNREVLAYGIQRLKDGMDYPADESEAVVQDLLRHGKDWDYVNCDLEALLRCHESLDNELAERFSLAVEDFQAENETTYQIKAQRVRGLFDRRIALDEQRLRTLRQAGRSPRMINLTEKLLQADIRNKEQRLSELKERAKLDLEQAQVAAGVFRVTGP